MTIDEAREILGNDCINVSDEALQKEIETAELLKNIFFTLLNEGKLTKLKKRHPEES